LCSNSVQVPVDRQLCEIRKLLQYTAGIKFSYKARPKYVEISCDGTMIWQKIGVDNFRPYSATDEPEEQKVRGMIMGHSGKALH
jgi:hypothetical protein